jgi:curved DNA-binding protein CbpA
MRTNPYSILRIPETASRDEIKRAYRRLAREYHPDRGGDAAAFGRVQEAYELLTDPRRRRVYDASRGASVQSRPAPAGPRPTSSRRRPQGSVDVHIDVAEVLEEVVHTTANGLRGILRKLSRS